MVYLIIMILVAAAGLGRLWLIQRRQASHLTTVEGFRASLERLSEPAPTPPSHAPADRSSDAPSPSSDALVPSSDAPAEPPSSDPPGEGARRTPLGTAASSRTLDPERRAAAKRRLEERRRAGRGSGVGRS
ncbi:MAG: hypothetical protein M3P18_13290 [Actinomycetota bacterium]|nr:hypothetical protein [Actinomycetota bacterium]